MYDLLKGLTVVEGAAFIAGPTCGLYLAQLGAEVIRFDQIGGGPDFRRWPLSEGGDSFYWEGLNKAKKSVAIDLSRPEGRVLAQRLAASSGLFVTNYPVEGFLSYERLKALREDLISIRVMGWADGKPGVDYTINASVGLPFMTGPEDAAGPVNHVLPAWDLLTGALAAFSLLAAERARQADGQGREVRLALSDVAITSLSHLGQIAEVLAAGADRPRLGNSLFGGFGRDFETRDGQRVMIVALTRRQWSGLIAALGLAEAVAAIEAELGVAFGDDEGARFRARERLYPLFERAFAERLLADIAPAFDAAGVTWSFYQPLTTAIDDPRFADALAEVHHPSGARYPTAGFGGAFAGEARPTPVPAPKLGRDTDEVLSHLLGLSDAEIGALRDAGLVAG
ncbi:MAG TPA: CoA transferase [Caulobacteraceae bacterium]|nr:CoA transferase [Caulobacteraceae bacterium]